MEGVKIIDENALKFWQKNGLDKDKLREQYEKKYPGQIEKVNEILNREPEQKVKVKKVKAEKEKLTLVEQLKELIEVLELKKHKTLINKTLNIIRIKDSVIEDLQKLNENKADKINELKEKIKQLKSGKKTTVKPINPEGQFKLWTD